MRTWKQFTVAAAIAALLPASVLAAFPERPIRLIVPFPPGGSTDVVARRVAVKAQQLLGQPIVVENRGGAGGIVGTEAVARAERDGYTLLLCQTSHGANPALRRSLPYDSEKDFTPIAWLADHPGLLIAHPSKPYENFADFVRHVKANPGTVTYASAGGGTFPHLTMAMLELNDGIRMVHVPYKGAGPARVDLLAGRVDVRIDAYVTAIGLLKEGKLKALAVTGRERISQMPQLPTVAESGFPDFESSIWMGIMGPAGLPADVTAKLERAFIDAAKDPEIARQLNDDGVYVRGRSGSDLGVLIRGEIAKWRRVVKASGIQPE